MITVKGRQQPLLLVPVVAVQSDRDKSTTCQIVLFPWQPSWTSFQCNSRLITYMTRGTCTSAVTMVTQSFNNADYYTGPSLHVPTLSVRGEERESGIHCLCMHIISRKSWKIGNYISCYTHTYAIHSAHLLTNNKDLSIVCSTSPSSTLQYS